MRLTFSYPLSHARVVAARLALLASEIGCDILYRAESDDIARFSQFPDSLVDMTARGVVEVTVDDGQSVVEGVRPA